MADIAGRCLCGQVHYTASGEPAFSGLCHCRNCQRYTGSSFEPVIAFPAAAVRLSGELKAYRDVGDSGGAVYRKFCPNCGSGVLAEVEIMPDMVLVLAGTLDDPASFSPTMEIFCASAQPWFHAGTERKQFDRMPG